MKTTKIYGIIGMVEVQKTITSGGLRLTASFTGGASNGGGVTPAKYKTSDPVAQYIIENSDDFKRGAIKLVRTIGEDKTAVAPVAKTPKAKKTAKAEEPAPEAEQEPTADDGITRIKVNSILEEGKQYLIDNCGAKSFDVDTIKKCLRLAKKNNIEFVTK